MVEDRSTMATRDLDRPIVKHWEDWTSSYAGIPDAGLPAPEDEGRAGILWHKR